MPHITNYDFQNLLQAAIDKYLNTTKNGDEATIDWKINSDYFKNLADDISDKINLSDTERIGGTNLLNNYYYKTKDKSKEVFKCNYDIVDNISKYAFGKDYFTINNDVLSKLSTNATLRFKKKRSNKSLHLDFKELLKEFNDEIIEDYLDLVDFDKVYIQNEAALYTGFYQDREAFDIISRYLSTQIDDSEELPSLSVVRECSLAYSLQSLIQKFRINLKLKVLCFEDDIKNKQKLEDLGCLVYLYKRRPNDNLLRDLNTLGMKKILFLTENTDGIYARDERIFDDSHMFKKNKLYLDLLGINNSYSDLKDNRSDFLFLPYKNGDIYNNLIRKINELNESLTENDKHKEEIFACSPIKTDNKSVNNVDVKYIEIAKRIYSAKKLEFNDVSISPFAYFLQMFIEMKDKMNPNKKYTILNIGKSNAVSIDDAESITMGIPFKGSSRKIEKV